MHKIGSMSCFTGGEGDAGTRGGGAVPWVSGLYSKDLSPLAYLWREGEKRTFSPQERGGGMKRMITIFFWGGGGGGVNTN